MGEKGGSQEEGKKTAGTKKRRKKWFGCCELKEKLKNKCENYVGQDLETSVRL